MPSKRNSKAGPAPVVPIPQAKATVAPPAPQIITKSTETPQPQTVTRKTSMPQAAKPSPAIEKQSALAQEKAEILSVLMDAGNDWKPRNKVVKHVKPKPKKHQSQNIAKAPTARPASANLNARVTSVAAKPMATQPTIAAAITKFKPMNAANQKEQEEILSVLMDAGKDWKPRNKVVKKFTPNAKTHQVIKPALKQTVIPASVKPTQKSQPVATAKQAPITPSTVLSQGAPKNATQQEKQEILSVLMDAGSDWKPRNRVVRKVTPKPRTRRPSTAKNSNKTVPAVTRKASLNRTNSLTDAQKKEKREIMEILLDYYDYVPHLPTRQPLSIQGNVQSAIQFAHDGNSVVVSGTTVENMSGFEEVKSRRTIYKEKKDCKEILNVLVDFKEPQLKCAPLKKNSLPTKTKTVDKAAPVSKHIQANKSHVRTKLAT